VMSETFTSFKSQSFILSMLYYDYLSLGWFHSSCAMSMIYTTRARSSISNERCLPIACLKTPT
jgi:hypothetical protein